jgi:hypothetical protein
VELDAGQSRTSGGQISSHSNTAISGTGGLRSTLSTYDVLGAAGQSRSGGQITAASLALGGSSGGLRSTWTTQELMNGQQLQQQQPESLAAFRSGQNSSGQTSSNAESRSLRSTWSSFDQTDNESAHRLHSTSGRGQNTAQTGQNGQTSTQQLMTSASLRSSWSSLTRTDYSLTTASGGGRRGVTQTAATTMQSSGQKTENGSDGGNLTNLLPKKSERFGAELIC